MRRLNFVSLALLSALIAGCGGSSSGGSSTAPRVTIQWPARTRTVSAPGSADYATISIRKRLNNNSFYTFTADRPTDPAAATIAYPTTKRFGAGDYYLYVEFFSLQGDTAGSVGRADISIKIDANGNLLNEDGSPLNNIALVGTVESVEIAPYQTIDPGQTVDLEATAIANSTYLATAPGSITWQITQGTGLTLNANGSFTATGEGDVTVIATVDGIASAPQTVTALGAPITPRRVSLNATAVVGDATRGTLWVADDAQGRIISIDPATGTPGIYYPVGSHPNALALSDDDSMLYASVRGESKIVPIALATGTFETTIPLPTDIPPYPRYAVDLAVQPGNPHTLAISTFYENLSGLPTIDIYDSGVARPRTPQYSGGYYMAWLSATRLAFETIASPRSLTSVIVDTDGPSQDKYVHDAFDGGSSGFAFADGRIYGADKSIRDATTFDPIGNFQGTSTSGIRPTSIGPAIDVPAKLAFFIEQDEQGGRLSVYRTDTLARLTVRRLVGYPTRDLGDEPLAPRIVRWSTKGLAVPTASGLFLIDDVPGL